MTARPFTVGELYDRAVAHGGDRVAITDGPRALTYRQLGDQALRLAAALQALGIGRGDRIAFLMSNCAEYVACEYAVARIGAARVPLAVLLGDDDHASMVDFAGCRTLVYHAKFAARVVALAPRLRSVEHYVRVGSAAGPLSDGHL